MMKRIHNIKTPMRSAVDLAVAALDGSPNPLDTDMRDIDPDRTSLDLPEEEHRPGADRCMHCGSKLCEECAAGDDDWD